MPDKGGLGLSFGDDTPVSTRRAQRAEAMGAVFSSILGAVVWTTALLTILGSTFGISLAPFLAGAGILGVALGFGAQDLVKDFISGIFMLIEDQYGVGDVIDVGEATGVVERVSLRTTKIRDVTGTLWHVPNGEIRRVGNQSQEWSRALLDVGVSYGTDVDGAAAIIKGVADEMAGEDAYRDLFLAEPEIWGVEALSADAVLIRLVVKTQPGEQWAIARELRRRIKLALDAAEIEIPFPQRTIWVRNDESEALGPAPSADPSAPSVATGKAAVEEGGDHPPDGRTDRDDEGSAAADSEPDR
jgi:small conductance mechanosensitive channel